MSPPAHARAAALLAALALAVAALFGLAAPAAAHDELIDSSPEAGASVDAVPAEITLTFSADILTEDGATEIVVTDGAGAEAQDGEPRVEGTVVTQPLLPDAAAGDFVTLWKVVSSDGHPISGELEFTVIAPTPTPTTSPTPTATTEPTAQPTTTVTAEPAAADADTRVWPWVVGGLLGLAVAGAVVYLLATRARNAREEQELSSGNGNSADQ